MIMTFFKKQFFILNGTLCRNFICVIYCYCLALIQFSSYRGLLMGFLDVAFLPSKASFFTFKKIVVDVKTLRPPHALQLWLVLSKGMLPVKNIYSNKASFCVR